MRSKPDQTFDVLDRLSCFAEQQNSCKSLPASSEKSTTEQLIMFCPNETVQETQVSSRGGSKIMSEEHIVIVRDSYVRCTTVFSKAFLIRGSGKGVTTKIRRMHQHCCISRLRSLLDLLVPAQHLQLTNIA